jgi:hypothetical protein
VSPNVANSISGGDLPTVPVVRYNALENRYRWRVLKLCVCGSLEISSAGFSASLAAVVGILARRPTLLIDLSHEPNELRQALGFGDADGIERLVARYIRTRTFAADDIRRQIIQYTAPPEMGLGNRGFGLMPGPTKITERFLDRLAAQRGAGFVELLIKECKELDLEVVVVYLGCFMDTLRGEAIMKEADLVVLYQKGQVSVDARGCLNQWTAKRGRQLPIKAGADVVITSESTLAFPDRRFVESLVTPGREYEDAASRVALECAESLCPSIRSELVDGNGKRFRPHVSLWRVLFG